MTITGFTSRTATPEETEDIITWFNSIDNVEENVSSSQTVAASGIHILLKSGKEINILYPVPNSKDFEVQSSDKKGKISYWGKQQNIKRVLEKASLGKL